MNEPPTLTLELSGGREVAIWVRDDSATTGIELRENGHVVDPTRVTAKDMADALACMAGMGWGFCKTCGEGCYDE